MTQAPRPAGGRGLQADLLLRGARLLTLAPLKEERPRVGPAAGDVGVLADGAIVEIAPPSRLARSTDPRVRPLLEPLLEAGALVGRDA